MSSIIYTPEHIKDPRNHARRIYFSCHEDDFCLFDQIVCDIREIEKDCIIAYRDFASEIDTEHFNEVYDFHLTIMPITKKWFESGIHAEEFDFLTDNCKAVLPILFDVECETPFNEKTNNLQFLRISDGDYKEKLKRNLDDILIDRELIELVEKVFTHKMFVGYCREDFKHTQELIRCVHGEESGRRIAIWYDKYLPTGKNFEDSIFKELDKSQIVGITTTPNLISRENYVKEKEYPHAKENDKKIIFFELLETKGEDVRNYFEIDDNDVFEMVKVRQNHAFSKYISELFGLKESKKKIPFDQNESDRLLGHAYLNGLFVEFDNVYALKKFKASANGGNILSAHQLGNMYYRGIGVKRDTREALFWYKEEVRLAEKVYRDIFEMLKKLKKVPLISMDITTKELKGADRKTFEDFKEAIDIYINSTDDILMRICSYASILRDEGDYDKAQIYYRKALAVIDDADGNFSRLGIGMKYRARIENELNLLVMIGGEIDLPSLKTTWESSLESYNASADNTSQALSAVKSGRNYGFALLRAGRMNEAKRIFEQSLEIADSFGHDKDICEIVILLHRDMGRFYIMKEPTDAEKQKQNADEALKWFKSENRLLEDFDKKFDMEDNPYLYSEFAWNKVHCGDAYHYKAEYKDAFKSYTEAIDETEKFEKKIGEKLFTADFPICILQLYAVAFSRISEYSEVSEEINNALCEIIHVVLERFGGFEYYGAHKEKADGFIAMLNKALKILSE